jgi:hypothetical protein
MRFNLTRAWRRRAPSSHVLPDGPGLAVRWAAAVPLMLVAAFGPVVAAAVYRAWADIAFDRLLHPDEEPTFGAAFRESLPGAWPLALVPLALTVGFLLRRNRMASWPAAVLGNAVVVLVVGAVVSLSVVDGSQPKAASLVAVAVACFWLGRAAEHVLSRPVAKDVARSRLEFALRLPRQLPRLRIQENRLVLDRLRGQRNRRGPARVVIPWHELTDVRWETVSSPSTWSPAPHARQVRVPAGPAIRIEAGERTWLLPARSEELARAIVTGIDMRAY